MIVNQQNLATLRIGFNASFQKAFDGIQTNFEKIATVVPSNTKEQQYAWLGQMPSMREWIGDRTIQNMAAADYTIKNKHFEMTIAVNRDEIEDDVYGIYAPMFSNMGECAATHPDEQVFSVLQKGFSDKCYDGNPFFYDKHKGGKEGKEQISNLMTKVLAPSSYGEARAMMMAFTGDKGKSLRLIPNLLAVPPQLEETARRILKADLIDGTTNVYKDTAEILVDPSLADKPTEWYLLCTTKALKPIIYQERTKIKFVSLTQETDENVFMQNKFVYGADGRNSTGYGFWQMAIGSKGTTAVA